MTRGRAATLLASLLIVAVLIGLAFVRRDDSTAEAGGIGPASPEANPASVEGPAVDGGPSDSTRAPAAAASTEVVSTAAVEGVVWSHEDEPVAGAAVLLLDEKGGALERTKSGEKGRFRFGAVVRSEPAILVARHRDHGSVMIWLEKIGAGEPLHVRLTQRGTLRGTLVTPSGGPPRSDVRLMVWPRGAPPPTRSSIASESPLYRTVDVPAVAAGSFEVSGLSRDQRYWLAAGGGGYVLWQPTEIMGELVNEAEAIDVSVESQAVVEVRPFFVLDVQAVGPDREALRVASELHGSGKRSVDESSGLTLALFGSSSVELAMATHAPGSSGDVGQTRVRFGYVAESEVPRVGPITVSMGAPGYQAASAEFWALRCSSNDLLQAMSLEQRVTGFGVARFFLDPSESRLSDEIPGSDRLTIGVGELTSVHSSSAQPADRFTFRLSAGPEPTVLDGVPFGAYRFRVLSSVLEKRDTSADPLVHIGPTPTEHVVKTGPWGAARFDVHHEVERQSRRYRGYLVILANGPKPLNHSEHKYLEEPPYDVVGLFPGTYSFRLSHPGAEAITGEIDVRRNELTTTAVTLRAR